VGWRRIGFAPRTLFFKPSLPFPTTSTPWEWMIFKSCRAGNHETLAGSAVIAMGFHWISTTAMP
jgi:hypothetical protein